MGKSRIILAIVLVGMLLALACVPAAPPPTPTVAPTPVAKAAPAAAPTPTVPPKPTATPTKGPPVKVTLHYPSPQGTAMTLNFIGRDKGYYLEERLEVDQQHVAATVSVKALIAGGHDFEASIGASKVAIVEGAPLKVVVVYRTENPYHLVTKPEIKTFADLKGKSFGVTDIGSIVGIYTSVALRKNGVDPDKDVVNKVVGPGTARLIALKAGSVDAVVVEITDALVLKEAGFNVLSYIGKDIPGIIAGLAVHEKTLREKPEVVKKMARAYVKSLKFLRSPQGKDYVVKHFSQFDFSPQLAAKVYDELRETFIEGWADEAILKADLDMLRQNLELAGDIPVSKAYDLTFAKGAAQELKDWRP